MSVAEITSRISQIQAQLNLLAPAGAPTASAFAAQLTAAGANLTAARATTSAPAAGGANPTEARVVAEAQKYLGLPYVWGGSSPEAGGMDCSGLVQHVYKQFGIDLPRVSADQARAGQPVASMAEARPGDLLAWDNSSRNVGADHIAIYVGDGKMIEAPRTGLDIRLVDVPTPPDYIRRVLPATSTTAPASLGAVTGVGATTGNGAVGSLTQGAVLGRVGSDVPFADLFNTAGARYGVAPVLLAAVAKQESGFDPTAVSPAGARGLMQLMPGTADGLGVKDSFDPAQAVDGAARLLRDLIDRFGRFDLALAGYNAGPGAVLRYDGIPPYPETQNYVRSVMSSLGRS